MTGFGADLVDAEVAGLDLPGMTVRTVFNPFYSVSDNLATCWLVRAELAGGSLLLNGDTLFEPTVAERLIAAPPAQITVTIDRKAAYDDDDMKVETEGDVLRAIGKTITAYDAESIGFLRFSAEGAALFTRQIEAIIRRPEGLKRWYLSVIDEIARQTGGVRVCSIEGLGWQEMDFPADVPHCLAITEGWAADAA